MNAIETTTNLNIDTKTLSACLKNTMHFGSTIYTNICTGAQHSVPWGGVEWAIAISMALCVVMGITFVGALGIMMIRELRGY